MARPAKPVVLLPGWSMDSGVWTEVRAALAATLGETHPVLTPALPGHDDNAPPAPTLADWADAVAAGLPDGAVLAGWSLGAMLAMEIAHRHAGKVAALVLIGANARFVADEHWPHGLAREAVDAFVDGFARDPQATLKRFVALQVIGEASGRAIARRLAQHSALPPEADASVAAVRATSLAAGLEILRSADLRATVNSLSVPCTIIHGEADALMPASVAHWLAAQLPHARLHLLPGAGHALPLSASAECARLIARLATADD